MGSIVLLIAGAWMAAQNEPAEPNLLRLQREQEFVYRGYCTVTSEQPGNRTSRTWNLQHCVLIRSTNSRGVEATFLTTQRTPPQRGISSLPIAQIEQATIESTGKILFSSSANSIPRIPLDAPPNLEVAAFVELPKAGLAGAPSWTSTAENGLLQTWKVQGVETISGNRCAVLTGEQTSPEWKNAASLGWIRQDKVWLDLSGGYAIQIERTILHRQVGGLLVTSRVICTLDDGVPTPCPGGLFRDRLTTIQQTMSLIREFETLQQPRGSPDFAAYENLLNAVDRQAKLQADTPYREAMLTLRRRVEMARQGERPPEPLVIPTMKIPLPAGSTVSNDPDFVLNDVASGQPMRLSRLRGKPVALFFFKPSSATVRDFLHLAQQLSTRYAGEVHVLAVATESPPAAMLALRNEWQLSIGIFTGQDACRLLPVESTPCIIILDKFGTTRLSAPGWGGEYPTWIGRELENVLHPAP